MSVNAGTGSSPSGSWWVRNLAQLKSAFRVLFGIVWAIDGSLKFAPGFVASFSGSISAEGQPGWLAPWLNYWASATAANPAFFVYTIGVLELALGLALITGFMRKVAYVGGAILSLFIWAIPEGFGGPYGPGSTDIGTAAVYAMLFFAIILINAMGGPSRLSLDYYIERRFPGWARVAEFGPARVSPPTPSARALLPHPQEAHRGDT